MSKPVEAADLRAIRLKSGLHIEDDDWMTSEALKQHFAQAKLRRDPMFLTDDEFFRIAHWKLISQYGRAARHLEKNTADGIERVTAHAFSFSCSADPDLELDVRVQTLRVLPGVGMGVASAMLALCYPESYAPIDFRVWRQLFGTDLNMFDLPEYRRNMARLRELVAELRDIDPEGHWTVQLVDYYCWERDKARTA
jgi:hypothetical protein